MRPNGLHILLTLRCTRACDHCFVWASPNQAAALRLRDLRKIMSDAAQVGSIDWIYFEGGEPFLYHPTLVAAARLAKQIGFRVGVVTNAYWATDPDDAELWLRPLVPYVDDLSVSSDDYHGDHSEKRYSCLLEAAQSLGIDVTVLRVAQPVRQTTRRDSDEPDSSPVRYRGRAAVELAPLAARRDWREFDHCPYEELREPSRVHVDPWGNVQLCQGISGGNCLETPLRDLLDRYEPDAHPVVGPLLKGGPAELARSYGIEPAATYADACHLCYETRVDLRERCPETLQPAAMYGVEDSAKA